MKNLSEELGEEFFIPEEDFRIDGITIDWERAEELYKKIYGEKNEYI